MENSGIERNIRLTKDNYFAWSIKVENLLKQRDCWEAAEPGYLDMEDEDFLDSTITSTETKKKNNDRALMAVMLTLSDTFVDYVGCG